MKKLILLLIVLCVTVLNAGTKGHQIQIIDQLLDADPTSIQSDSIDVSGWDAISFVCKYDETEVGGVSAVLTVEAGDGDNWFDYDILLDKNGTDVPSASIAFTADDEYAFYLPQGFPFTKIRVTVTATGSDADDTIQMNVTMFLRKN